MADDPPEELVSLESVLEGLTPDERRQVDALVEEKGQYIRIFQQLREAFGMSNVDFLRLMQEDEFEGLPAHVRRSQLTLTKIMREVRSRGGTLSLVLTFGDKVVTIPA